MRQAFTQQQLELHASYCIDVLKIDFERNLREFHDLALAHNTIERAYKMGFAALVDELENELEKYKAETIEQIKSDLEDDKRLFQIDINKHELFKPE